MTQEKAYFVFVSGDITNVKALLKGMITLLLRLFFSVVFKIQWPSRRPDEFVTFFEIYSVVEDKETLFLEPASGSKARKCRKKHDCSTR